MGDLLTQIEVKPLYSTSKGSSSLNAPRRNNHFETGIKCNYSNDWDEVLKLLVFCHFVSTKGKSHVAVQ